MSQTAQWYLEVSNKIAQGIGAHTIPTLQKYLEEIDGLEGQDIAFVQIGSAFTPDNLTPESFIQRGPYGNPTNVQKQMDASVERGWLELVGENQYQLTEKSKQLAKDFFGKWDTWFGNLPALSEEETNRAAKLLEELVKKAYQEPKPARKPTMEVGIRLKPKSDSPTMLKVRRYITDLAYYREDAHIAAWQPYEVDGKTWETLTYLWRDEAATSEEMTEKIGEYRNYSVEDYTAAFDELVSHGWATTENGKYQITDKGKNIRQEAEDVTDQLFFAPFDTFSKEKIKELKTLLEKLAEVVTPPETEAEPE